MKNHLIMERKSVRYDRPNPNSLTLESDIEHIYDSIHIHDGCEITTHGYQGRVNYKRIQSDKLQKTRQSLDAFTIDKIMDYWSRKYEVSFGASHKSYTISSSTQLLILQYSSEVFLETYIGGRLLIKCKGTVMIEKGAKITVNSCGYPSGDYQRQGESYIREGALRDTSNNGGGGGAGLHDSNTNDNGSGGGGGYATKGMNGTSAKRDSKLNGIGGAIYGDKYLSKLYLGSGGGGGGVCIDGGDGGGAIQIECQNLINYGEITANGGNGRGAGAGSGGSIHLIIRDSLTMNKNSSMISAKGGIGGKWGLDGSGGHGRIRIDCGNKQSLQRALECRRVLPLPYCG